MGRFLQIKRGSANELEYHLLLARDLRLLQTAEFAEFKDLEAKVFEIQRMLASFAATVKSAAAG